MVIIILFVLIACCFPLPVFATTGMAAFSEMFFLLLIGIALLAIITVWLGVKLRSWWCIIWSFTNLILLIVVFSHRFFITNYSINQYIDNQSLFYLFILLPLSYITLLFLQLVKLGYPSLKDFKVPRKEDK